MSISETLYWPCTHRLRSTAGALALHMHRARRNPGSEKVRWPVLPGHARQKQLHLASGNHQKPVRRVASGVNAARVARACHDDDSRNRLKPVLVVILQWNIVLRHLARSYFLIRLRSERSARRPQCLPQMFALLPAVPWGSPNPRPRPPRFPGNLPRRRQLAQSAPVLLARNADSWSSIMPSPPRP
jgi:hypothetical protein